MANNSTIFDELIAAARGVVAIAVGDKRAPASFDFTPRGLAGSFIAFLIATVISVYLQVMFGGGDSGLSAGHLLVLTFFLLAVQIGFSALVLRQMGRLDGLVPYLVADNWSSAFLTAIFSLLTVLGLDNGLGTIVVGLLILVIEINIGRLIVTLKPWQIAMFIVAQMVGVGIGLVFILTLFPLPAELLTPPS